MTDLRTEAVTASLPRQENVSYEMKFCGPTVDIDSNGDGRLDGTLGSGYARREETGWLWNRTDENNTFRTFYYFLPFGAKKAGEVLLDGMDGKGLAQSASWKTYDGPNDPDWDSESPGTILSCNQVDVIRMERGNYDPRIAGDEVKVVLGARYYRTPDYQSAVMPFETVLVSIREGGLTVRGFAAALADAGSTGVF